MIPSGLFTQIGMVILSIAIITTYIKPAFAEVGKIQDDINLYQQEREKVISVNTRLATLRTEMESVSTEDKRKLLAYLPDTIDSISVSRDIFLITQEAGVHYKSVKYGGLDEAKSKKSNSEEVEAAVTPHLFSVSVETTYDQLKGLLRMIERNSYPLEVRQLSVQKQEGGFLSVTMELATYTFSGDNPEDLTSDN